MNEPIRDLCRFPSGAAAEGLLADLKAAGHVVTDWAITPGPNGSGVILAVEIA